jgi:hypothetical protein
VRLLNNILKAIWAIELSLNWHCDGHIEKFLPYQDTQRSRLVVLVINWH